MLKTIQCTCSSDQLLISQMWMCFSSASLLPILGSDRCFNRMTKQKDAVDDEELSGDEDDRDEEDN